MHGLQSVADVRQGAPDDHAHGVIEIRTAHLVFYIDGNEIPAAVSSVSAERKLRGRWRRPLRWIFLICQRCSLKGCNCYFSMQIGLSVIESCAMKRNLFLLFAAGLSLGIGAAQTRAFTGARLIDGSGKPAIENATLIIRDGRVEAGGPSSRIKLPAKAER